MTNIRTKQLSTGKVDILLVDGLPEGAHWFEHNCNPKKPNEYVYAVGKQDDLVVDLPLGNWKFISTIEKLSEEEADELVEKENINQKSLNLFDDLLSYNQVLLDKDNCPNQWCINGKIDQGYGNYSICAICEEDNIFFPSTTLIFIKE